MCLIVDSNCLSLVLTLAPCDDLQPLQEALFAKRASAAYGGKLAREYLTMGRFRRLLLELDRQGIFRKVSDTDVDAMTQKLDKEGCCTSNDAHIIALARVSGVRLVCSYDQDLHADFTNPNILSPPGSVYQRASHLHLIRRHCKRAKNRKTIAAHC